MALNDVVRVTASYSGVGGNLRQFVWHYLQAVAGDPGWSDVLDAILAVLVNAWSNIDQHISDAVEGTVIDLALWDDVAEEWNTLATADASAMVGTNAGSAMPGNVSPYVTFYTQKARSRGKKFLFDVAETVEDDGLVSGAVILDMAAFAGILNNNVPVSGVTYSPCNYNYLTGEVNNWSNTVVGTSIFSGSQYKRLAGRGA